MTDTFSDALNRMGLWLQFLEKKESELQTKLAKQPDDGQEGDETLNEVQDGALPVLEDDLWAGEEDGPQPAGTEEAEDEEVPSTVWAADEEEEGPPAAPVGPEKPDDDKAESDGVPDWFAAIREEE
jgi:hypothetical protein